MRLCVPAPLCGLVVALFVVRCQPAPPARDVDSATMQRSESAVTAISTPDSLRLQLVSPAEVRAGATVPLTVRLENVGSRPLDLYLRGRTIAFDIVVTRATGDTVWRRLQDEIIPAVIQFRALAPGEVLELRHDWDQRDNRGRPVAPGDYVLRGSVLTDAPAALETALAPLRIVPS